MLAFDLRRLSHQRQIHRDQLDGQLFQEMERFSSSNRADPAFDDIVEFAPIDPVQKGLDALSLLLVQGGANLFSTRFLMEETDQREAIEHELFAHGAPPSGAHGGGRPSRRTCP